MNVEPVNIALAKALKVKNRLAGRIAATKSTIQTHNSVQASQAGQVDVNAAIKSLGDLTNALVTLKSQIAKANLPVQADIFSLAEKKAEITLYSGLMTCDGAIGNSYGEGTVTYVATIKKSDADMRVRQLERDIDDIQDRLDNFNVNTEIEIPAEILALAR